MPHAAWACMTSMEKLDLEQGGKIRLSLRKAEGELKKCSMLAQQGS